MAKYVQHISGQGEKWKVNTEDYYGYQAEKPNSHRCDFYDLPKSEYIEVPAPEVWTDVTGDCAVSADGEIWHRHGTGQTNVSYFLTHGDKQRAYRLCRVKIEIPHGLTCGATPTGWAFIVEKREP